MAPASPGAVGNDFPSALNKALHSDNVRLERCRCRVLDPAQDARVTRKWAHCMARCDITDPHLCYTHDKVSPRSAHGPHEGLYVEDLVQSFVLDQERPEAITPLIS